MKKILFVVLVVAVAGGYYWLSRHPLPASDSGNVKKETAIDMTRWIWEPADVIYLHPEVFGKPPAQFPGYWDEHLMRDASIVVAAIEARMGSGNPDLNDILRPITPNGSAFEQARMIVDGRVMKDYNAGPKPNRKKKRSIYQHMGDSEWARDYVAPVWDRIVAKLKPEQQLELAKKIKAANPSPYR